MGKVVRILAGDITNSHYNFVVAKPLVSIITKKGNFSGPLIKGVNRKERCSTPIW